VLGNELFRAWVSPGAGEAGADETRG